MVIVNNKKFNYAMLYVPKAACSVMRKTYIDLHYDEFTALEKTFLETNGIHRLGSLYTPLPAEVLYDLKKFIVCRSPYTRALSAYYDKFLAINIKTANYNTLNHIKNSKDWKTCRLYNLFSLYQITQSVPLLIEAVRLTDLHKSCPSLSDIFYALKIHDKSIEKIKINDSFYEYLLFIQLCKNQQLHSHKQIIYDEHHDLQTRTLLRYNINKIFSNIQIVKIEEFTNLYNVYKELLPIEMAQKAQQIHKDIVNSRKFSNATPLNSTKSAVFYDLKDSTFHYKQRDSTQMLYNYVNMLSPESKHLIHDIYEQDFCFLNYIV